MLDANRYIADALGALRAKEAVPALTELVTSPDGYVQVAAVDALGRIGDPAAIETLVGVATGEEVEPFTAKKALLALGADRRPARGARRPEDAVRGAARGVVLRRGGVRGRRRSAARWRPRSSPSSRAGTRRSRAGRRSGASSQGALYAKSAQLLGDVGGADAVPALLAKLAYRDADPGVERVRAGARGRVARPHAREGGGQGARRARREGARPERPGSLLRRARRGSATPPRSRR